MATSALMTACISVPIAPNSSNPIHTVAVLPLVNNTNDVDGPVYVRTKLAEEVSRHAYIVKPLTEVDQTLKDQMGVTLGAQLDMTSAQKLGEVLGVDGVLYGSLEDFSHNVTGLYNVKRVRIRTKLVNCRTGETVWSHGIGIKNVSGPAANASNLLPDNNDELKPLFGTNISAKWMDMPGWSSSGGGSSLVGSAVMGIGEKVVSKTMKAPLSSETTAAVSRVLTGIPAGPEGGHIYKPAVAP
jgi:hypothetical protein